MPASEEYLAVSDLTELTSPTENDQMMMQASGEYGDVMLMSLSNLVTFLQNSFAVLDSPEFTGTPSVPDITDPTADDQQIANTSFVQAVAEGKANANAPEITGTAKFIDAAPLTVDGDGNEVAVATQSDISALRQSISDLTTSINNLAAAVETVSTVTTVAIPASTNKITVSESETMATKSGGTIMCCIRFNVNSAISSDTQILQLPVGYRPERTYRLTVHSWNGSDFYALSIYSTGGITIHNPVAAGKSFIFSFAIPAPDTIAD